MKNKEEEMMKGKQMVKIRENEELWINYLEGELEPSLKEDLDIQLKSSLEAQKITSQYERLKLEIKNLDIAPEFSPEYYNELHDKIMNRVSQRSIQSPIFSLHHQRNKLIALAASFLLVLGSVFAWNLHQSGNLLNTQDDVAVSPIGQWMLEKQDQNIQELLEEEKGQLDEDKSLKGEDILD